MMKVSHAANVAALAIASLAACNAADSPSTTDPTEAATDLVSGQERGSTQAPEAPAPEVRFVETSSETVGDTRCPEGNILFHCRTTTDKEILICDNGSTLAYHFGASNTSPELELSVLREHATTYQWQGIGRWINYSITIPSGNARYTVFTSIDRLSDESRFEAGVIAEIDGEEVARILCTDPVKHDLEGTDLRQDE